MTHKYTNTGHRNFWSGK